MSNNLIGIGWEPIFPTGTLFQLPSNIIKQSVGVIFYSNYNDQAEIDDLHLLGLNFEHVLFLNMEDFETDEHKDLLSIPTTEHARRIKHFCDKYIDHDFVVSCAAGISRTGAVVEYLRQHGDFKLDPKYSHQRFVPNEFLAQLITSVDTEDN